MNSMKKLPREFYMRDTVKVTKDVLGKVFVHQMDGEICRARIVDVEAYLGTDDKAAHSYSGRPTKRTAPMFEAGGIAYVYLVYGLHYVMNIVTEREGVPEAIMLRGVQMLDLDDKVALRRYRKPRHKLTKTQVKNLSNGPGKLTQAMGITTKLSGVSLTGDILWLEEDEKSKEPFDIGVDKRIGIDYAEEAVDFPLRFFIK